MLKLTALLIPLVLAACGADGPPTAPSRADATPGNGLTLSGDARLGIVAQLD